VFSKDTGHEINFGMIMSKCLLQNNLRIVLISKCFVIRHIGLHVAFDLL